MSRSSRDGMIGLMTGTVLVAVLAGCVPGRQPSDAPAEEAGWATTTTLSDAAPGTVEAEPPPTVVDPTPPAVAATVETEPVPSGGDAADDVAIWVHPGDPGSSTIIGTDKQGGVAVYDLAGAQLQYLPHGNMNNVDLRNGFSLSGEAVTLVAASDRLNNRIAFYTVEPGSGHLVDVAASTIGTGYEPYGLCLYHSRVSGALYVFVTEKDGGTVTQWQVFDDGHGQVDAREVGSFSVGSQSEGCVADDELGYLYLAEEQAGIWKYGAEPGASAEPLLIDSTGPSGHLVADVEGLAIALGPEGSGYLIASSQGSNSFVVYRRQDANEYLVTFTIEAGNGIDGVEDSDGIDVTTEPLGPTFPNGVLVAQDGENDTGNQNFKLVPWEAVETLIEESS